jgi:hypothetical protein
MFHLRNMLLVLAILLPTPSAIAATAIDTRPWPRQYTVQGTQLSLYRPQPDSWKGNQLQARAVMTVKTGTTKDDSGKAVDQLAYGVAWLNARTETDIQARQVVLSGITVTKVSFPTHPDQQQHYLALIQQAIPKTNLAVSQDQLETALAIASNTIPASVKVNNTPPDIIFSFNPAILVLVDGDPTWRPSSVSGIERVINTRALLLRYQGAYYLGYGGHWASAASLNGPWTAKASVAPALSQAMQAAVSANQAPAAKDVPASISDSFKNGQFPTVYVRTHPSELIQMNGDPQFAQISNSSLVFASNTPADVFIDTASADQRWYVLISGRWFSATSSNGPWAYVAQGVLPASFKQIPADGPKGSVLASIAGTPQAREALIANSIAQTATVNKATASFQSKYDGAPKFVPISGTNMSYAANSATPIINVPGASYYALYNGVWFRAEGSGGPWAVTTIVPAAIYTIPASSPVHYVTYAQVYGGSDNEVYVGYTPGYYGTVVSDNVVVYGTGYACNSWVGGVWYGCPATYGYGAAFALGAAAGWALAFGWGWYDPWYSPWWGPWGGYYSGYYGPWAYGGAVAGNVYGHWGNAVVGGTAAAWANPFTGNYGRAGQGAFYNPVTGGRGYGYGGRNTNYYTGVTTAAAGGVRYNPQTGRVVAGRGGSVGNIYTGAGAAAGQRTVVNTNTGRVTDQAGAVSRSAAGATAAGGFNTSGAGGNAAGAGYAHYNRATGRVNTGGAVDVNGNIYAGRDGNVYRHDENGWEKAGGNGQFQRTNQPAAGLDNERAARDRGFQRDFSSAGMDRGSFNRGSFGGGGGMHGGGFRGRR